MRSYWLRIVLGMLVVFAVGMLISHGVNSAKSRVRATLNSSDPIPLPIAFFPFRLNGREVGDIDRVYLLRSDPKHISGVRVAVKVPDTLALARLKDCLLTVDDKLNDQTTFTCRGADTAGRRLVRFGVVTVNGAPDSLPLLLPADAVRDIRRTVFELNEHGLRIDTENDSLDAEIEAMADSIAEEHERMADSLEQLADSISEAASRQADSIMELQSLRADSIREEASRKADSIRAARQRP